jgi:hypothetical protein
MVEAMLTMVPPPPLRIDGTTALMPGSRVLDARVVHQDGDRPEAVFDFSHHRRPVVLAGDIKVNGQSPNFLSDQRIGTPKPASPVRVATGTSDSLVPHAQARRLAADRCAKGADVTYQPVALPDLGSALVNHFTPLLTDQGDAIDWLTDRLNGKQTTSNCAILSLRP